MKINISLQFYSLNSMFLCQLEKKNCNYDLKNFFRDLLINNKIFFSFEIDININVSSIDF